MTGIQTLEGIDGFSKTGISLLEGLEHLEEFPDDQVINAIFPLGYEEYSSDPQNAWELLGRYVMRYAQRIPGSQVTASYEQCLLHLPRVTLEWKRLAGGWQHSVKFKRCTPQILAWANARRWQESRYATSSD